MGDIKEIKQLVGEADNLLTQLYLKEPADNDKRDQIHHRHTDALALLENMEDKIKDVIADMDWRGLHNDAIILRRLKDIIPPRTSEEETERMKVRWPKKSPAKE